MTTTFDFSDGNGAWRVCHRGEVSGNARVCHRGEVSGNARVVKDETVYTRKRHSLLVRLGLRSVLFA